ncbi:MAG: NTP/NDP exchange transporter [Alphaproteobacteria bacterium]|nr:NTP/NDP exchange transporter [Alphaproteobacteria bacterium]
MSKVSKETVPQEFTGLRAALWPIHNYELKKFLPLGLIMFCLLFNYTLLRDTKDTLVVTSAGAGAITFLKLYCVTPAAILFVLLYAKLTNILSREAVFYAVVAPFLVFFAAFAFIIYPNLDTLHPSIEAVQALHAAYPALGGFIDLYAYWSFSLFYVLSEIWGSAMIALMFWQFANHVVRTSEAKRFYPLFGVIANFALILSGQVVVYSSSIQHLYPTKEEAWKVSLYLMMGTVVLFGMVAMGLYRWMTTSVLTDKRFFDPEEQTGKTKKKKEKPSLGESIKTIFTSPELGLIAILIMAYGVTINLVEVQWKHQLGLYAAGDKGVYNAFMGNQSTVCGIFTILFGLFVGSNILRRVSWFKAALITPLIITLGGVLFFSFILGKDMLDVVLHMMKTDAVTAATFLGVAIIIVGKGVKYILFDPTKEMAYIPLSDELKTKGKAAVDVIGGRAGKAGGAFVQSTLLMAYATKDIVVIALPAFIVFGVVCLAWLYAVKVLSVKVDAAVKRRKDEQDSKTA